MVWKSTAPCYDCYNDWWAFVSENLDVFVLLDGVLIVFRVLSCARWSSRTESKQRCMLCRSTKRRYLSLCKLLIVININGFLILCFLSYIGRMRSLLNLEKRERSLNYEGPRQGISHGRISSVHVLPFSGVLYLFVLFAMIIFLPFYFYLLLYVMINAS